MKKFFVLLLVFALLFTLVACSGGGEETGTDDPEEGTEEGTEETGDLPAIGVTIYKFDDNFMSFVRRAIESNAEGLAEIDIQDSQNDQGKQNEHVDMMISRGVKSLAINL